MGDWTNLTGEDRSRCGDVFRTLRLMPQGFFTPGRVFPTASRTSCQEPQMRSPTGSAPDHRSRARRCSGLRGWSGLMPDVGCVPTTPWNRSVGDG